MEIGGCRQELIYRCAPLNEVKMCSQSDFNFVAPISRLRACPDHPDAIHLNDQMKSSTECPVEFAYI